MSGKGDYLKALLAAAGVGAVAAPEDAEAITAWHGSPYKFTRFLKDKIGTGEGAQAYGHGLYFAGDKNVADYYKNTVGNNRDFVHGVEDTRQKLLNRIDARLAEIAKEKESNRTFSPRWGGNGNENELQFWRSQVGQANSPTQLNQIYFQSLKNQGVEVDDLFKSQKGSLYKTDLAPAEDEYLLWDKPLSEQSEKVKEAIEKTQAARLENNYDAEKIREDFEENGPLGYSADRFDRVLDEAVKYGGYGSEFGADVWAELEEAAPNSSGYIRDLKKASFKNTLDPNVDTGESIYKGLASEKGGDRSASEYLHSLGIRGIKYLDAASRGKGEGHYNYVIFDPKDVKVLERNNKPVMPLSESVKLGRRGLMSEGGGVPLKDTIAKMGAAAPVGAVLAEQRRKGMEQEGGGLEEAINPVEYLSPARFGGGLMNMGIDAVLSKILGQ